MPPSPLLQKDVVVCDAGVSIAVQKLGNEIDDVPHIQFQTQRIGFDSILESGPSPIKFKLSAK